MAHPDMSCGDEIGREFLIVSAARQLQSPKRLPTDAEDALNQRHRGFDHAPFPWKHLAHSPFQVRLHTDGKRSAPHDNQPGNARDRLQSSTDSRDIVLLEAAKDAFGPGQHIAAFDLLPFPLQHASGHFGRWKRQEFRNVQRRDVAGDECLRHHVTRADKVSLGNQHLSGDRQDPPHAVPRERRHREAGSVGRRGRTHEVVSFGD